MRKLWGIGCLLLILVCAALSTGAETLQPDQVSTWEEARQFAPALDELWHGEPLPSYTQKTGFSGLALAPEEAYRALLDAYEAGGDEGTRQVLTDWGLPGIVTEGQPVRHALEGKGNDLRVETIGFAASGWGEENTLVFVGKGSGWQLIDCLPGETGALQSCGDQGLYLECVSIGHGTGYYCRDVEVYNLLTRQMEAAYTAEGYESWYREEYSSWFQVQLWGAACYARDGLQIFCRQEFSVGADLESMPVKAEQTRMIRYLCDAEGALSRQ